MTSTTQLTPFRYETPTVTLEVMAREAAISQWSDVPVVQVLRFQLQVRSLDADTAPIEIRGDRDNFLALHQVIPPYIQSQLTGEGIIASDRLPGLPYLEAEGLTRHTFHLDGLTNNSGAAAITLGAIQLADLGNVLSQLDTRVRILPVALTPSVRRRPWRQWSAIAASAVAAVGITTTLWPTYQFYEDVGETALEAPISDQQATAPAYPKRVESADAAEETPLSEEGSDESDESDETAERPDAAKPDLKSADTPTQTTPAATTKTNQPNAASMPSSEAATAKPGPATPIPSESLRSEDNPSEDNQDEVREGVAPSTTPFELASPSPSRPGITSTPTAPAPTASAPTTGTGRSETQIDAAEETAETSRQGRSADSSATAAPTAQDAPASTLNTQRSAESPSEPPSNPNLADLENDTENFVLPEAAPQPATRAEPPTVENAPAIPNLDALAAVISEQWMPPANLTQTLTYLLTLKTDGTLAAILPADDLSVQYRDRTGLPSLGTQILPPQSPTHVQVLLYPNGNVQVQPIIPAE